MIYHRLWLGSGSTINYQIINIFIFKDLVFTYVHEFFYLFIYIASMTRFVEIFRKLFELRLANYTFFKNKHFELCCFVMYRVRNIVNRKESDVICHSVRRSRVPTSILYIKAIAVFVYLWWQTGAGQGGQGSYCRGRTKCHFY